MKNMFKSALAGLAGIVMGIAAVLPLSAQSVKPHGKVKIAYVPIRQNGLPYYDEIAGKLDFNLETKLSEDLRFTLGADVVSYANLPKINFTGREFYARLDYKNYEFYASCSFGGDNIHNQNNILQVGAKIKIGSTERKKGFSVNPTAAIDVSYVPQRTQFGAENKNEIKTEFEGNVEIRYNDFFVNIGGVERTYENFDKFKLDLLSFFPNTQEYTFSSEIGYGNLAVEYLYTCSHPIAFISDSKGTWVGNNFFSFDTPLYVADSGEFYWINQGSITEIGASYSW